MIISGNESDSKKPQESPQSEWTTSNETTVVPSGSDFDPDPDSGGDGDDLGYEDDDDSITGDSSDSPDTYDGITTADTKDDSNDTEEYGGDDYNTSAPRNLSRVVMHKFVPGNLFYNIQMNNPNTRWTLSSGTDMDGSEVSVNGIMTSDEWGASVSNDFSTQGFSDPIGDFMGSLFNKVKGFMPYMKEITDRTPGVVSAVTDEVKEIAAKLDTNGVKNGTDSFNKAISSITNLTDEFGDTISKGYNTVNDVYKKITGSKNDLATDMNGTFMSGFDLTKVFNGSSIDLALPTLETTILSGTGVTGSKNIISYVNSIIDHCMGAINPLGQGDNMLWGILSPPNGFKSDFTNIDSNKHAAGTWTLKFKGHTISNLLVTNFSYSYSTITCKGRKPQGTPLYAVLRFNVAPAKWVGQNLLKSYNNLS
jgi:hypothetical protein